MSGDTKLRLKVTSGNIAGSELTVEDELVIGREASEEGRLGDDIEISRQHARISRTPQGGWAIEDLGSRNGTFLNEHRIEHRELLAAGDAIEIGSARLVVQVSSPTTPREPQTTPPEPAPLPEPAVTVAGDVVGAAPPPAEAEPEPEPETVDAPEAEPPAPPRVSLSVELDFEAGEALISLHEGSDSVKLLFEDGAWRLRPEG